MTTLDDLKTDLAAVDKAAVGDSGDAEIETLREACETALQLLDRKLDVEQGDEDDYGLDYDEQTAAYEADTEGDAIARLARASRRAQQGDSNDKEIDVFQELLSEALTALGLDGEGNPVA